MAPRGTPLLQYHAGGTYRSDETMHGEGGMEGRPLRTVGTWLLASAVLAACAGDGTGEEGGRLVVAATVSPITNIVQNVGGDRVEVTGIVPEGTNSHTFEPAPSDARILAEADVVFVNGLALEEPTIELAAANLKPGAE